MAGDVGLFGPGSVTWRIHGDPSMIVGGLRSLLAQALNPRAMAGVDQHSDFRVDPWGRLRRTADYVGATTFGDTATAEAAGAMVRAVHRRVRGVDPHTGRTYSAGDHDLLAWIHNVEVHSFLVAYRHYGGRVGDADADRYVAEMVGPPSSSASPPTRCHTRWPSCGPRCGRRRSRCPTPPCGPRSSCSPRPCRRRPGPSTPSRSQRR
jgi:uncharacterized protein (DUF2236 family)